MGNTPKASADAPKRTTLKTKLGALKLEISGNARNDALEKLALNALAYLIWHVIPQKAYGKDEPFKRDSKYSPELEAHVFKFARPILEECFSEVEIKGLGEYIKPNTADGIIANLDKISDADFARIVAAREAKVAKASETKPAVSASVAQAA